MSWLYLQAEVAGYSPQNICSDGKRSVMSKESHTRSRSSKHESMTGFSTMLRSGMMQTHSTGVPGLDWWMSSLRDSRASHLAMQGNDSQIKTTETDGLPPSGSFARYDPQSHGWKMLQVSLHTNTSEPFSGTWRRAGMVSYGIAYQQKPLERITRGTGFGSLPTPKVSSGSYDNSHGKRSYSLRGMALHNLWPTPLAGERDASPKIKMDGKPNLAMLARAFPTPTVNDAKNSTMSESQRTRSSLVGAILRLLPTPTMPRPHDSENTVGKFMKNQKQKDLTSVVAQAGGQLNPNWVEWLMGWPIGWTDIKPLAMGRFQKWFEAHSFYFCKD